jgi:G protein-coupled glucose receptor regulating Gpa2
MLSNLGRIIRNGLVAMGLMSLVSVVSTLFLLIFMLNRMLRWKAYYKENLWHNQYIILILCLLVADFVQSLAFAFSFYWLTALDVGGPADNPSGACFAQGFLVHFGKSLIRTDLPSSLADPSGDVGSAFFVLAVAAHTCFQVGFSRRLTDKPFYWGVGLTTLLSLVLTIIPPAMYGREVYEDTDAWVSRTLPRSSCALKDVFSIGIPDRIPSMLS